jgi:hypothetical protein
MKLVAAQHRSGAKESQATLCSKTKNGVSGGIHAKIDCVAGWKVIQ